MPTFSKILVAVDFSKGSRSAVDYAIEIAGRFSSSLTLLHVISAPQLAGMTTLGRVRASERASLAGEARERCEAELSEFLESCGAGLAKYPYDVVTEWGGDPAQCIIDTAASISADLVVMGTRGRTGVSAFLLGSAAKKTVARATCPVMIVPFKDS